MLRITMSDLFYGFIRNYYTFGLTERSKDAKWTHEILEYFAKLGKMLGFDIEYEWRRFDLVWFWSQKERNNEKPSLHVEHENAKGRLFDLLDKLEESRSANVVVIGYPANESDWEQFVEKLKRLHAKLKGKRQSLVILDEYSMKGIKSRVVGHTIDAKHGLDVIEARRRVTKEDGIYHLEPLYRSTS